MEYLSSAIFCFIFITFGVLHIARNPAELWGGMIAAVGFSLGVVFISPVFLTVAGFSIVALGWSREGKFLAKTRPKRNISYKKKPGTNLTKIAITEGLLEARVIIKEGGLSPWEHADVPVEDADAMLARAKRSNPFRPEGPSGYRYGSYSDVKEEK